MIIRKLIFLNKFFLITSFFILSFNSVGYAYIGLGPLIPVLGNIIVWVFVTLISIFGLVVYPIKKILDKTRNKKKIKNRPNLIFIFMLFN